MTRLGSVMVTSLWLLIAPTAADAAACVQDSAARSAPDAAITLAGLPGRGIAFAKGGAGVLTVRADGGAIPRKGRSATASVVQPQDKDFRSPDFSVVGAAHVLEPGDRVQIRLCTTGGSATDAGVFPGQVTVFGPTFRPRTYDYTVTARYAAVIPVLLLAVLGAVYAALMWANNGLPPVARTSPTNKLVFVAATFLGFALAYFTVYRADPTWGDAFVSDLVALVTGGFTVAAVVTGAMAKLIKADDAKPAPVPEPPRQLA